VTGPGHLSLALGVLVLGATCLASGGFTGAWAPAPPWLPWKAAFAYLSGVVLVSGGLALFLPRAAKTAALALTVYQLVWLEGEAQKAFPGFAASWTRWLGFGEALGEALAAAAGCFILHALLAAGGGGVSPRLALLVDGRCVRVAQILFGVACVAFGLSHFAYVEFTAGMIPSWLPARPSLVYLTGACHIAAGLAVVTRVQGRLAATLEGVMLGAFVFLVHLPSFFLAPKWAPSVQVQATELGLSLLVAGAAGVVARSLGKGRAPVG
jgi:uncharacterized membrane protein